MKDFMNKYGRMALSIGVGIVAFLFWYRIYPGHVVCQEQLQMFLYDAGYAAERISVPGGLACYLSDFLIQFFGSSLWGALILALLSVGLQLLLWGVAKRQGASSAYYPLTFLPMLTVWHFLCDENAMLSFPIALLMCLAVMYGYLLMRKWAWRMLYVLCLIPLLYGVAGAVHFVFTAWLLLGELQRMHKEKEYTHGTSVVALAGLLAFACPWLCSHFLPYSLERLMAGVEYYRYAGVIRPAQWYSVALVAFLPGALAFLPSVKKAWIVITLQVLLLAAGGYRYVASGCNMEKEEALQYDRLARVQQWLKIIAKAEKKHPDSPFAMAYLNLALAKQGELGHRMFEFHQQGTGGLLPAFVRDFISPLPAAEAYYHIGMVNTAQRYMFEAMEAIPNYRKSVRCMKRLVETSLINGDYKVAEKYLHLLKKTLFYDDWAEYAEGYLYNEEKINAHPEWGKLRKMRVEEDFLFNGKEHPEMLGKVFSHSAQNKMASEYRLAYLLLRQDLDAFVECYATGNHADVGVIPRSHQEALAYVWLQRHGEFKNVPWALSPAVMQGMIDFAKVYMSKTPNGRAYLQAKYGKTYWGYLLNVRK